MQSKHFKSEINNILQSPSCHFAFPLILPTLFRYRQPLETGTRNSTSCSIQKQFLLIFRRYCHSPLLCIGVNLLYTGSHEQGIVQRLRLIHLRKSVAMPNWIHVCDIGLDHVVIMKEQSTIQNRIEYYLEFLVHKCLLAKIDCMLTYCVKMLTE